MADQSGWSETKATLQLYPGRALGWINLGASMHAITSKFKAHPQLYPQLSLSYSWEEPVLQPIHLSLPKNDIRLRFDGPDQRLRLIELTGWSQTTFTYKSTELVRRPTQAERSNEAKAATVEPSVAGPSFRHIYNRLFGPAYAGEYIPPAAGQSLGTYVLSYPGLAIRFPLKHSAYSDKADFVSLLSSAALPATSIAIFSGSSWPEARQALYTKPPPLPRSLALGGKNTDSVPDEIENVIILGGGQIELKRHSSPPFIIKLSETTPQDLIAELGPPDAIYRKPSSRVSIHADQPITNRPGRTSAAFTNSTDTQRSNSHTSGLEDEPELDTHDQVTADPFSTHESFYNYFHHGFDILISQPSTKSPAFPGQTTQDTIYENKLVVTKIFLHGNIPGSYSFNRHRRSRWTIPLPASFTLHGTGTRTKPAPNPKTNPSSDAKGNTQQVNSEMLFSEISHVLGTLWSSSEAMDKYTSKGMVLNRGWSADQDSSPESSVELLGGTMTLDDNVSRTGNANKLHDATKAAAIIGKSGGNTQLFGFPGMLFEVLENGCISCVSIY